NSMTVTVSSSKILGFQKETANGTITLGAAPRSNYTFTASGNGLIFSSPITVLAGSTTANFTYQGSNGSDILNTTLTLTYGAPLNANIPITILPLNEPYLPCYQCEAQVHKPVNLINGNVWITQQDYALPGLGGGIQLERTWNSLWRQNNGSLS